MGLNLRFDCFNINASFWVIIYKCERYRLCSRVIQIYWRSKKYDIIIYDKLSLELKRMVICFK